MLPSSTYMLYIHVLSQRCNSPIPTEGNMHGGGGLCLSIQNPRRPLYIVEKTLTFHAHAMNSFLTLSRGAKSKNISVNPQLAAEQTKVHVRVLLTWS